MQMKSYTKNQIIVVSITQQRPRFGLSPVLHPWTTVQFLGPIVPRLLGNVPVIFSNCVRIHFGPRLALVPTVRSNAAVNNWVEAVDSLRSKVSCKRLDEHSLSCLGCRKSHLWIKYMWIGQKLWSRSILDLWGLQSLASHEELQWLLWQRSPLHPLLSSLAPHAVPPWEGRARSS